MELQPKNLIIYVMSQIAEIMKPDGFQYLKSKSEITKKTNAFIFKIWPQSNRNNKGGETVEMIIHCSVSDNSDNTFFWGKTLAHLTTEQCELNWMKLFPNPNAKQYQHNWWELYPKEKYEKTLKSINEIIKLKLLPFFRRFENDLENFVVDVSENGFCAFGEEQVYDAGYNIPIEFILKYGTKNQLNIAFQNYYDRHQLDFVKTNMKKAVELLMEGKEVKNNGEKDYAEFIIKHELKLKW